MLRTELYCLVRLSQTLFCCFDTINFVSTQLADRCRVSLFVRLNLYVWQSYARTFFWVVEKASTSEKVKPPQQKWLHWLQKQVWLFEVEAYEEMTLLVTWFIPSVNSFLMILRSQSLVSSLLRHSVMFLQGIRFRALLPSDWQVASTVSSWVFQSDQFRTSSPAQTSHPWLTSGY